ncbi:unnamed protein product, partial [Symbiodinium necroappetens]
DNYDTSLAFLCLNSATASKLQALVLVQGVQTAQNLDYLTLCVQAEALRNAAAKCDA